MWSADMAWILPVHSCVFFLDWPMRPDLPLKLSSLALHGDSPRKTRSIQLEAVRMGLVAPGRHTDHHEQLEFDSLTEKLRKADTRI